MLPTCCMLETGGLYTRPGVQSLFGAASHTQHTRLKSGNNKM